MKFKKLLILFFVLFLVCGCDNSKKDIIAVCTKSVKNSDGLNISVTDTSKYDDQKLLYYNETVTVESGFTDKESYESRKKLYSNVNETMQNNENYKYIVDDNNKTITIKMIMNNFDLTKYTDEEKKGLTASVRINSYESSGYTCKISGTTRKRLGLK